MVSRRLNKPVVKIGVHPLFWFRQVGTTWFCRSCGKQQIKDSVAFEMTIIKRVVGKDLSRTDIGSNYDKADKLYLCLACSDKLLKEALNNITFCQSVGAEGYMLFTKI